MNLGKFYYLGSRDRTVNTLVRRARLRFVEEFENAE